MLDERKIGFGDVMVVVWRDEVLVWRKSGGVGDRVIGCLDMKVGERVDGGMENEGESGVRLDGEGLRWVEVGFR